MFMEHLVCDGDTCSWYIWYVMGTHVHGTSNVLLNKAYEDDQFIQKYDNYIRSNMSGKSKIINMCISNSSNTYKCKSYLKNVTSPEIRNIIVKFRIDCNNTNECKSRSFKKKNSNVNPECHICQKKQDVEHILLHCADTKFVNLRKSFSELISKHVKFYNNMSNECKISQILNVKPMCHTESINDAVSIICKYIKDVNKLIT